MEFCWGLIQTKRSTDSNFSQNSGKSFSPRLSLKFCQFSHIFPCPKDPSVTRGGSRGRSGLPTQKRTTFHRLFLLPRHTVFSLPRITSELEAGLEILYLLPENFSSQVLSSSSSSPSPQFPPSSEVRPGVFSGPPLFTVRGHTAPHRHTTTHYSPHSGQTQPLKKHTACPPQTTCRDCGDNATKSTENSDISRRLRFVFACAMVGSLLINLRGEFKSFCAFEVEFVEVFDAGC